MLVCAWVGRAAETQVLLGHVPAAVAGLAPVSRLAATRRLHLAISLPLRNRDALSTLLQQLYDPSSPSFHHFLTSEQFTAAFGPTKEDYQAVINFARSNGLTVTSTRANRALVEVDGPVANIEKAFHVNMRVYPHPTERRNFYAPDTEPSVDLEVPLLAIAGLTDYLIPHSASLHTRKLQRPFDFTPQAGSESGLYIGLDFRGAYASGVTNTGTGQSVGLVEFDSYYAADITSYLNISAGGLSGSAVMLSNVVIGSLTGPPGTGNTEVALDIDMAISMAPGLSTIYVYEATNDAAGPDAVLSRMASDNLSRQLSCSWTGFSDTEIEDAFLEFSAQGQSFFQASGDSGEYIHRKNPVQPPADDTNVTSVGGTTLSTTGPKGNWSSETTWSWFSQPQDGLSNSATSGGISPTYTLPSWQSGISMTANQGSTSMRDLPDVAMVANQIYLIANNGGDYFAGGTSAAAPLWAGFTALINQQRAAQDQPSEGFLNSALYAIGKGANYSSCFHDITVGNNTNLDSSTQFFAVAGYDLCDGWGTPIGAGLLGVLAPEPLQITPLTAFVSSGPYGGPFSVTNQNFTLTNAATASFNWALAIVSSWLSANAASGTLVSSGAAANVSVGLNSAADSLTVGAYTNTVTFSNLNDAVARSFQVILTVSTAAPDLTWTSPASITYGTALGSSQLDAAANVPGSFAYAPSSGTVLNTGTHTLSVVFRPTDAVDYSSATNTVSLVVLPASLTVTAANTNRPYGQANPVFTGTITGVVNGDNITAAYSCSANSGSPTGTYPIVPSLVDPSDRQTNYTVSLVDGTLTVEPVSLVVTWTNPAPILYGAPLTSNQLNATANVPGSFAYTPTNGTVLNTGTNTLSVIFTPTDTVNYSNATNTVSLVVSPATLTVTAANTNRAYDQFNPVFTGTIIGVTNGDDITATYNCGANMASPVGLYPIVPSLTDPNDRRTNYTVNLVDGTLMVTQAVVAVSWTNPTPITYGSSLTSNQLNATVTVPGSFAYTPTNGTVLNTGTNALSVIFTPSDSVDYSNATNVVSLVVSPAALTVMAANTNRAYGQASPAFTGTVVGVMNGDNITAAYGCIATTGSPVGLYSIVPSLIDPIDRHTNYTVNFIDGTLTVTQAVSAITWTNPASIIYGTSLASTQLNATASAPGNFAYTPTNGTVLNTGTNALSVIFTPSDTVDYSNATNTVSLIVLPAALTVTVVNTNRAYGQGNPVFTGAVVGVTNGDNITAAYSCSATTGSPVGLYSIVPSLIDPSDRHTNYTVNLTDGTLTVSQAMATISWTSPSPIIYGASLTSNQLNATANVPGNFVYTPTNGTVPDTGADALSVIFTPSDSVDYSNATNTVSLAVLPAVLTVTAANTNRVYGQANPLFTGTVVGVTNGDNITAAYSCSATNSSLVGMYPIVPSLTDPNDRHTNYTVNLIDSALTVTQAASAMTWTNPGPVIYGTALTSNQLNATASLPGSFVYAPTNGAVLNTGTNALSAIFMPSDTLDYGNATDTVSLIVSPATLTVTAANTNRAYGQANPLFTGAVVGVTNQDDITATYSCSATTGSPIGLYSIVPSLTDPSDRHTNYTVDLIDGTLTVTQATSAISWTNPAPIIYGAPLTTNQLNATANVPGILAYTPTNGAVLNTGTNALSVIFTPSDTEDYGNATNMVSLIVSPTTLTVTAANTNRTYGQANPVFMGTVTGLTNGDDITASYSCSATTASPVGTYAIAPSLTDLGDRLTNYTVSLINGTLAVAQAVSGISWANPIAIIYGTALASNQLNATANVPGIFTYAPSNGTVPGVGTNTLYVVFTPSDTVDYNNATNTVSLIVSSAPLTIVSGVAANSKVYDGTTAATLSFNDVTLAGILNGDSVSLATNGYSAAFESAGVGHAIAVTVSGLTLTGPAAGNYILTQPVTLAADITLPSLQVAARFPNIVLLWTTNATVFVLNQTRSLIPPVNWSPVTNSITASGTNNTVLVNAVNGVQYFELIAAP